MLKKRAPAAESGLKSHRLLTSWRLLLIGLGVLLGVHLIWLAILSSSIGSELQSIRDAGYPATAEELNAWHGSVPDDENAALVIQDALDRIYEPTDEQIIKHLPLMGEAELPDPTEALPEEMRSAIEKTIARNEHALELLHEAAGMNRARYPADLSKGLAASTDRSLPPVRTGVGLLVLEAVDAAERGDGRRAARSIRALLGVARSLDQDPELISQLVRLSIQSGAVRAAERTLNRATPPPESAAALSEMLAAAENPPAITTALAGERALFVNYFADSRGGPLMPRLPSWTNPLLRGLGIAQLNRLACLDVMGQAVEASELPTAQRPVAYERVEKKRKNLPFYAAMADALLPTISDPGMVELVTLAELRAARMALAVERYRMANDRLPETLDALRPEFTDALPADPFTSESLIYKRLKTGYTVYSVNKDKTDDGGVEARKHGSRKPGTDIPFTVRQ